MNDQSSAAAVVAAFPPKTEPRENSAERVALELTQYIRYWDPAEKAKKSRKDILNLYAECLQVARMGRHLGR